MKKLVQAFVIVVVLVPMLATAATYKQVAQNYQDSCMSHSTDIPYHESVCFSSSMLQYTCVKRQGKMGLEFTQKLSMRSSLKEKSSCYHVDYANNKPARDQVVN